MGTSSQPHDEDDAHRPTSDFPQVCAHDVYGTKVRLKLLPAEALLSSASGRS